MTEKIDTVSEHLLPVQECFYVNREQVASSYSFSDDVIHRVHKLAGDDIRFGFIAQSLLGEAIDLACTEAKDPSAVTPCRKPAPDGCAISASGQYGGKRTSIGGPNEVTPDVDMSISVFCGQAVITENFDVFSHVAPVELGKLGWGCKVDRYTDGGCFDQGCYQTMRATAYRIAELTVQGLTKLESPAEILPN